MGSARGQASVEYVGILAVLALVAAAAVPAAAPAPRAGLPRVLAGAILPGDGPGAGHVVPPAGELATVERLMEGELEDFLRYRASAERNARLDYSTDECSAPVIGSSGRTFDFTHACLRHDFGYRNLGRLGVLDERRREVDELFLADMRAHCATRPRADLLPCLGWARDFYRAVRAFGWIPASQYR